MKKVVIFDAYGTLFDVNAAARNYSKETADINFINTWEKVSKLWRDKQIAYTWYYTSIGYKTNFWKVTEDSLDYALEFYNLKDNKIRLKDRKSKFEYSDYQKSERDFAFVVDKKIKAQDLLEIITSIDKNLIKSVKVFDVYEGENIPSDKKSIALNVTIQSSDKTLDDNDLEKINNLIISTVENKSGAKIRS